ncbi:MAG: S-layer homology domain-containing protein [Candidatus Peregrinibacteria bacterium]|nr:S-layer homology domain-containing protein [Candidatus Peregrinibacteria bacterium]
MNNMKKFLVFGVLIFALLSQSVFASFTDVPSDYKFFKSIDWMEKNGVVEGYGDGNFGVDQLVSRAEFLKMLYGAMGTVTFDYAGKVPFTDVFAGDWYFKYVKKAYADGIINGYPDGTFGPNNTINLAESVKIVANAFLEVDVLYGNGSTYKPCEFDSSQDPHSPDASFDTGAWSWKYIYVTDNLCIIPSTTNVSGNWGFDISRMVTRSNVAEMIYRAKAVHDNVVYPATQGKKYKKYDGNIVPTDLLIFNTFDVADLKVGMEIGDLTVKSFGPFNADFGAIAYNNLKVVFEGEMTVAGKYTDTTNNPGAFGPITCFYPNITSDAEMPHLVNDELSNQWFCFNNIEFAQSKLGTGKTLDEITIGIKNYTYIRYPSEVSPTADLVEVMAE